MLCNPTAAITNTVQWNHPPNSAAVSVHLAARERAQCISAPYVTRAFVWCLVSWNITQPHTANWISEWLCQGSTDLQKCRSHVKILHTRRVKHSKFHTEDPKTLGVNVKNLVAWATWRPESVHPWFIAKWLTSYGPPSPQSLLSCTQWCTEISTKCRCEML